ncbi:hypothetical protein [Flexibacterium corallicola]|uniref:hypothetical protein n=1 Tax=Flexibacterium corallicola TaxID=3037259 RepID=UPI00286F566A|nr:hypothetical protein [Pseudovibrio sp. M1P-2-3]
MATCYPLGCRSLKILGLVLLQLGWLTSVSTVAASDEQVRYSLIKTEEGIARLDVKSGDLTLCRERSGQLVCNPSVDATRIYETEIERLSNENSRMRESISLIRKEVDQFAHHTEKSGSTSEIEAQESAVPSEAKKGWLDSFDKDRLNDALDLSGDAMRRFFGMVEELKKDFQMQWDEETSPNQ